MSRIEDTLKKAGIPYTGAVMDLNSVRVRLADTDAQLKAKDLVEKALNPDAANPTYIVALNLLTSSPNCGWIRMSFGPSIAIDARVFFTVRKPVI
mgnify:CR=1 FL=1